MVYSQATINLLISFFVGHCFSVFFLFKKNVFYLPRNRSLKCNIKCMYLSGTIALIVPIMQKPVVQYCSICLDN